MMLSLYALMPSLLMGQYLPCAWTKMLMALSLAPSRIALAAWPRRFLGPAVLLLAACGGSTVSSRAQLLQDPLLVFKCSGYQCTRTHAACMLHTAVLSASIVAMQHVRDARRGCAGCGMHWGVDGQGAQVESALGVEKSQWDTCTCCLHLLPELPCELPVLSGGSAGAAGARLVICR
jgi:hypothetical protein